LLEDWTLAHLIATILALNPPGGFPPEIVQFGFPYRKCLARAFSAACCVDFQLWLWQLDHFSIAILQHRVLLAEFFCSPER
jgi:hypothetical protein|tara:strand:+ start:108 stop:350 length:243 start_codon:yes stop_codon:yes gene_type:complete